MKKIYKHLILLSGIFLILGSCQKKEFVQIQPLERFDVQLSTRTLILNKDYPDSNVLQVTWNKPQVGFSPAPAYFVQIDLSGSNFANAQEFPAGNELQRVIKNADINNKLLSLSVEGGVPVDIEVRIKAKFSDYKIVYSEALPLTVTPYTTILDLSTEWGVVGSGTPGGWGGGDILDLPFYQTDVAGVIVAYVTLQDGEIKFRKNNGTVNVGDDNNDLTLEPNGANIPVTAGTYKITFDTSAMTYTIEPYTWGLVGDATPNGWNGPDLKLEYNPYNDNWKAAVTLTAGDIKFRLNNDWATNYGDTGADGTLDTGGDNITVSAGNYIVTFDPKRGTYSLDSSDLWGLVGDATPNGWNGPDTKFLPDFGLHPGKFYINGISLTTGAIKVRQNDAWGVNYGDDGNDGTLDANGANIPVNAGTYNIEIDFAVSPPTIAIHAWQ